MFLFNFKKKTNSSNENQLINNAVANPSANITLSKAKLGLENNIVRLKKEKNIDLSKHHARVFVVIDRSGSMKKLYENGSVQNTLTRLLPLALQFDDNGELEVYLFNEGYSQLPVMNLGNYENYVKDAILSKGYRPFGGTYYSPVLKQTISDYNKENPLYPAFCIFITDGNASDSSETDQVIRKSSNYNIFYQFVGIGQENFAYLQKLDDLDGRSVDNTAFIKVSDFSQLDDDQLYAKLLEQYPQWLRAIN